MNKLIFLFFALIFVGGRVCSQNSTGINNSNPNTKASLDIGAIGNQGLLIPRLASTAKASFALTSSDKGMLFYGTDTDSIYYWTGTKWRSLAANTSTSPSNFWSLGGNTPDSNSNYLGTSNDQPLILSTAGVQRMRIGKGGNIGININPIASVLMSLKSTGVGRALQILKSNTANNIFEVRETTTGEGELDLYNAAGVRQIQLNAGATDNLFLGTGNFGIGVTPAAGAKLEVRGTGTTGSTIALRLTNITPTTLFTVDNAGDVYIPKLVGPGVVTANAAGLLAVTPGAPVVGTGLANKVAFWDATGTALSANTNFHWDNTNARLGIGVAAPIYTLQIANATATRSVNITNTNTAGTLYGLYSTVNGAGTGTRYGARFLATGGDASHFGLYSQATGGTNAYGIYAAASGATTNWAGYFAGNSYFSGNVGIGTTVPNAPLQFSNAIANRKIVLYETANDDHQYYGFGINGATLRYQTDATGADHVFFAAASATSSNELMRVKGNGNVGIGIAPSARLSVAGNTGQVAHIGNIFSGNYAGITLNGTISDGSYNLLSSSADPNLYINRATGNSIQFRENNTTQLTINPAGDNVARTAHVNLTSANTWGTSLNIANSSSGGSVYSIVSTGASHPLGAGSFVIQDGLNSNYAFVLNSATADTYLCVSADPGPAVGIGYANVNTNLAGSQKLQVNGRVCSSGFDICSDLRYKTNIISISNALDAIRKLRGVTHYWNIKDFPNNNFDETQQIGVIAQEVEKLFPQLVMTDKNGYKTVDYARISPILIEALKELDDVVKKQNSEIENLKNINKFILEELGHIKEQSVKASRQ
jgi:hypothetical protein